MKKFLLILICIFLINLVGCDKKAQPVMAESTEQCIASEIASIKGVEEFDDELIKALSIVIRSNKSDFCAPMSAFSSERILNLTLSTGSAVLSKSEGTPEFSYSTEDKNWSKQFTKSQILSYLNANNIMLSSISSAQPNFDSSGNLESISIGAKKFDFDTLAQSFELPSKKITNISSTAGSITIYGERQDRENCLYIQDFIPSNNLSCEEILSSAFPASQLINQ